QRISHREVLGHADHGIIYGCISVRVVGTHDLTDHVSGFTELGVVAQPLVVHDVEDAAVDRFEPVTDVWEGAGHDHAHGVIKISRLHDVFDADSFDRSDVGI